MEAPVLLFIFMSTTGYTTGFTLPGKILVFYLNNGQSSVLREAQKKPNRHQDYEKCTKNRFLRRRLLSS